MNKKRLITNSKDNSKVIVAKKVPIIEQPVTKTKKKKPKKKNILFIILLVIILSIIIGTVVLILSGDKFNKILQRCESGYDYIDEYCETYLNEPAVENIVCSNNFHEENGDCVMYSNALKNEDCPIGYWTWLGKCKKSGTQSDYSKCGYNSTYDSWSNTCYAYVEPTITYKCVFGTLNGTKCRVVNNNQKSIKYDCSMGYKYDSNLNICQKYIKKDLDGNVIN